MSNPKPIALVGVPTDDRTIFDACCDMLHKELPDYHVLTFIQKQGTKPHIEVHNAPIGKTGIISLRSLVRELCEGRLTAAPASMVVVEQDPKEESADLSTDEVSKAANPETPESVEVQG